jgi:hypothetical protein
MKLLLSLNILVLVLLSSGCVSKEQIARRNAELAAIQPIERANAQKFVENWPHLQKGMSPTEVCRFLAVTTFDSISPDQVQMTVDYLNHKTKGRTKQEKDAAQEETERTIAALALVALAPVNAAASTAGYATGSIIAGRNRKDYVDRWSGNGPLRLAVVTPETWEQLTRDGFSECNKTQCMVSLRNRHLFAFGADGLVAWK